MDRGSDSEDSSSTADSDDSLSTKGRPVKRRKAEKHGMEYVSLVKDPLISSLLRFCITVSKVYMLTRSRKGLPLVSGISRIRRNDNCRDFDSLSSANSGSGGRRYILGWRTTSYTSESS